MPMRSRFYRFTAFDLALIALNPALITLMVYALVAFLALVFYQGEHAVRLNFILFLFTMGMVCVSRIAIELGTSHATPYGAALAFVTWLALMRFVSVDGVSEAIRSAMHVLFIAVAWWASDRLTRDCTVLKEERAGGGRGLLETAGLEAGRKDGTAESDSPQGANRSDRDSDNSVATDTTQVDQDAHSNKREKKHPHGVWVIYFGMAAVPLFGFGQMFLDDPAERRRALLLFCQYLASALALLATTSLLGIRAYLRRRNLSMPAEMTAVWLGTAGLIIVLVMALALLLPRPAPEWSLVSALPALKSPQNLRTSRWGILPGVKDDKPGSLASREKSPSPADSSSASPGSDPSKKPGSLSQPQRADGDAAGNSSLDPANDTQKYGSPTNGRTSDDPSSAPGRDNRRASSKSTFRENSFKRPGEASQAARNAQNGQESRGRGSVNSSPSEGQRPHESHREHEPSSGQNPDSAQYSTSRANETEAPRADSGQGAGRQSASEKERGTGTDATAFSRNPLSRLRPPAQFPNFLSGLGGLASLLLRVLYWLLILAGTVWLLWKYRVQVMAYLEHLKRQWKRLLEWWFGTGRVRAADEPRLREVHAYFQQLANPFVGPRSDSLDPTWLVRYTFHALEAWARDMGTPRTEEQTPWEFVQSIAEQYPALGQDARALGNWYGRLAYGDRRIPQEAVVRLRELWRCLAAQYRPPAPTGVLPSARDVPQAAGRR
ncbi:MAG: hypothetical protein KatS3mg110_0889 [Pirellulaceae bacterium]|nr:MAG: hypothetical protein KatS3mg110_0889 [Pirellulaceae bacterium]